MRLPKFLIFAVLVFGITGALPGRASAACDALASDKGQALHNTTIDAAGTYTVWLRMATPDANRDSVYLQVDDQCPINMGDSLSGDGLRWVNYRDGTPAATVAVTLTAGLHAIKFAGREAGVSVDKVMLISGDCIPTALGDNCLAATTAVDAPRQKDKAQTVAASTNKWAGLPKIAVLGASIVLALAAIGVIIWKYIAFERLMAARQIHAGQMVVGGEPFADLDIVKRLVYFVRNHVLIVVGCVLMLGGAVAVGIAAASSVHPVFEAESSLLSGGAKVADNSAASGGKYVTFDNNPAGGGSGGTSGGSKSGSSGGGSSSGGTSGGGSSGGSSGGSTSSCALPKYPDATCTGVPAGTSLTVVNGDQTYSTANQVIEGKDIRGCVDVTAPGVIIRKSKIAADCFYVILRENSSSGTPLLIEDSEISCNNNNGTAVGDRGITLRRVNIHGCENGLDVNNTITIEDSYIHDLYQGTVAHTDGMQLNDAAYDITVSHNTIYGFTGSANGTSAIISSLASKGGASNVLIQNNLLAGGAYTVYCVQAGPGSNYRVINNHFSRIYGPNVGAYAPWTDCDDEAQVTGNVYHESGLPVPF